jgi:hypothetical protein
MKGALVIPVRFVPAWARRAGTLDADPRRGQRWAAAFAGRAAAGTLPGLRRFPGLPGGDRSLGGTGIPTARPARRPAGDRRVRDADGPATLKAFFGTMPIDSFHTQTARPIVPAA